MHNKTTLLLLLALFTCLTNAKAQNTGPAMNKTTGLISRLKVAKTINLQQSGIVDSVVYYYSVGRGYNYDLQQWEYDSLIYFNRATPNVAQKKIENTFDNRGEIVTTLEKIQAATGYRNNYRNVYQYDNTGRLEEHLGEHWNVSAGHWNTRQKRTFIYHSAGKTIYKYDIFSSDDRYVLRYDSLGRIIDSTLQIYNFIQYI